MTYCGVPWSAVAVDAGVAMVPPVASHGTPHGVPRNPMPNHEMPWGGHGMPWVLPCPCHAKFK